MDLQLSVNRSPDGCSLKAFSSFASKMGEYVRCVALYRALADSNLARDLPIRDPAEHADIDLSPA